MYQWRPVIGQLLIVSTITVPIIRLGKYTSNGKICCSGIYLLTRHGNRFFLPANKRKNYQKPIHYANYWVKWKLKIIVKKKLIIFLNEH